MAKDLLEKGAILQRDKETYAIAPHIAGGIIDPASLKKIAEVAEKYKAAALKITSAQRIAIVGLKPEDLDGAWADLGMKPGAAIGLCVRSVKICPGTTFCKRGLQDSVGVGLKLDEKYHGMEMPSKFKIGVSGCPNSCAEPAVKDLGLMGKIGSPRVPSGINLGAAVELTLLNGKSRLKGSLMPVPQTGDPVTFKTFEEFKEAIKTQLVYLIKKAAETA